jgi:hypothetical protein
MSGKLLKGVGLALIAMPEPFTTPLGIGLVAAAWVLSRHQESQKKAYVRHLLGEYLHTYRPFGYGIGSQPRRSAGLPYREKQPLYHAQDNPGIATKNPTIRVQPRPQATEVVHHAFDRVLALRRFDTGGGRRGFEGYWGRQTKLDLRAAPRYARMAVCLS